MTTISPEINVINFKRDTTLRWSCRKKDFVVWVRWSNLFSSPKLKILDLWEMRDSDFITITNRIEDLPEWFGLHPTEVFNTEAFKMMAKIEAGYIPPKDPQDGPNIWRLQASDRLAWIGQSRPD